MPGIKHIIQRGFRFIGYDLKKIETNDSNLKDVERLLNNAGNAASVKLHFGCGPRVLKEWLNIDLSYEPFEKYLQYYTDKHYPESIRGNRGDFYQINILKNGLPLADNSVDVIFHEDFFEHLNQKEQFVFLAETLRVLKKGAVHRINTPNIAASMRDNSDFTKGKSGVWTQEWDNWDHYSIVSPAILQDMAQMVGYADIIFNSKNKSIVADQLPLEYRPDEKDRTAADSNVFADLIK